MLDILKQIQEEKYKEYDLIFGGRIRKMESSKLPCIDDEYVAVKSPFRDFGEDYTTYFILLQAIRITAS